MDIALSVTAFLLAILGIAGCIIPVIPGVVLSYAALLCTWGCSYSQLPSSVLWIWLAATLVVSAIDYFLPAYMTHLFGGSRAGAIGATVGVFAGFFFFPPIGIVLGPFIGAVLGELLNDKEHVGKAFRVGIGSFFSFVVGTGLKLAVAIGMAIQIWADTYPVMRAWVVSIF